MSIFMLTLLFLAVSCHGLLATGMQIFVRTESGKTITLDVEASTSCYQIKYLVRAREGIPVFNQKLFFFGNELDDARELADYNIQKESTLDVVLIWKKDVDYSNTNFHYAPYFNSNPSVEGFAITRYIGPSAQMVIPATIEDIPVVSLGIESDDINGIVDSGLRGANQLPPVTSILIPSSIPHVANSALFFSSLTSITVDSGNSYYSSDSTGVLFDKNKTKLIQYPPGRLQNSYSIPASVTTVEDSAFQSCQNLTAVILGNSVSTLGNRAFQDCTNLTSFTIADSVTSIGNDAFLGCMSLTGALTIPNSVAIIGLRAFGSCHGLTSLTIGSSVTSIGDSAFQDCTSLRKILFLGDAPPEITSGPPGPSTVYYLGDTTGWGSTYWGFPAILVTARDVFANPSTYSLYTATQYNNNNSAGRTAGRADVTGSPFTYGLYTTTQYNDNYAAGQQNILSNPNPNNLYTTSQIHNLGLGGIVLDRNASNELVLHYEILQSSDLLNWIPFQSYDLPISNASSDKMFLRVQAVAP
jgi:hypothetical protein